MKIGWCESDRMSIWGWIIRAQENILGKNLASWKLLCVQLPQQPGAGLPLLWNVLGSEALQRCQLQLRALP